MEIEVQYEKAPVKGCNITLSTDEIKELRLILCRAREGVYSKTRFHCWANQEERKAYEYIEKFHNALNEVGI